LSGNSNNGTLTNGPTFSSVNLGSIVFDGVDDFVSVPSITWTPTAFSISWYTNGNNRLNFNQGIGATNGWGFFNFHTDVNGQIYVGIDVATRMILAANTYIVGVNQQFTFTYSGGSGSFYKNSALIQTRAMTAPGTWTGFSIGSATGSTINGILSNIQVYNRALSVTEITQNYNSTKTRFGL
jgi:hypothetical protein